MKSERRENVILLASKIEQGATSKGMQAPFGICKRQKPADRMPSSGSILDF
jgi:hypothetical protein